jgi:hypothetical protein
LPLLPLLFLLFILLLPFLLLEHGQGPRDLVQDRHMPKLADG